MNLAHTPLIQVVNAPWRETGGGTGSKSSGYSGTQVQEAALSTPIHAQDPPSQKSQEFWELRCLRTSLCTGSCMRRVQIQLSTP